MKYKHVVIVMICLVSCKEIKKENYGYFSEQFAFITENEKVSKLNIHAEPYQTHSSFIYFADGGCDLCSLDLSEIENLNKSLFSENNINPIVVLYGNVNNYTLKLIKDKNIYNYSIYSMSYHEYDSLMNFSSSVKALLVRGDGKILYEGNPFAENKDMNNLLSILNEI